VEHGANVANVEYRFKRKIIVGKFVDIDRLISRTQDVANGDKHQIRLCGFGGQGISWQASSSAGGIGL